jgi:rare lipoprotein A
MRQSVISFGITASLLAMLSACTTLPAGRPAPPEPAAAAAPAPVPAGAAPTLRPGAPPESPAEEDDKALLAGETPRMFEQGKASWYGPRFHGRRTASGERYDMHALTAAHKTLPFGTVVRVRSMITGREVDVRITDRGPFSFGRVIDLSRAAAAELGLLGAGVNDVLLLVPGSTPARAKAPPPSAGKRVSKPLAR